MVAPGSHILFCKIKVQNDVAPDLQLREFVVEIRITFYFVKSVVQLEFHWTQNFFVVNPSNICNIKMKKK